MSTTGEICDVWDGAGMQGQLATGMTLSCDNLAISILTDGVPFYKSS